MTSEKSEVLAKLSLIPLNIIHWTLPSLNTTCALYFITNFNLQYITYVVPVII